MLLVLTFDSFIDLFVPFTAVCPTLSPFDIATLKSIVLSSDRWTEVGHTAANGTNKSINESNMSTNST